MLMLACHKVFDMVMWMLSRHGLQAVKPVESIVSRGDACGVERSDTSSASELPPGLPAAAAACAWTRSASVTDLLIGSSSSAATCDCTCHFSLCISLRRSSAALQWLLHSQRQGAASFQTTQHVVSTAELSA